MLFRVFFLLGIYVSAAGSQDFDFVCGFGRDREEGATGQSSHVNFSFYQSGTVRPVILFGKLKSPDDPFSLTQLKDRNGKTTQSSADLLDLTHRGSLAHNKTAESLATGAVVGPPDAPEVSFSAGDGQVVLRWGAPADNGSPVTGYEYQQPTTEGVRGANGVDWTPVDGGASADSLQVTGLTNGTPYTFWVRAVNAVGAGDSTEVMVTPQSSNTAPVLGGPPMVSLFFAENATSAVDTLTAYDADGDTLGWSLAGADSSAFRLAWLDTSRRALHFKTPPNHEALAGSFGNVYALWVIVRDAGTPSLADSVSVAVTIQDMDDAGVVALSSLTPQVGDELKATLTDEDVPLENPN